MCTHFSHTYAHASRKCATMPTSHMCTAFECVLSRRASNLIHAGLLWLHDAAAAVCSTTTLNVHAHTRAREHTHMQILNAGPGTCKAAQSRNMHPLQQRCSHTHLPRRPGCMGCGGAKLTQMTGPPAYNQAAAPRTPSWAQAASQWRPARSSIQRPRP